MLQWLAFLVTIREEALNHHGIKTILDLSEIFFHFSAKLVEPEYFSDQQT